MNELGTRSLRTVLLALGAFGLGLADPAAAAPRLYTGSIEFRISTFDGCTSANSCFNDFDAGYPFPFGASISYPSLNNPPSGNLASVSGSGPAAIGLGSNQITLHTSLYDTSPPASWNVTFAGSSFSGGHAAGWLSAGGTFGGTARVQLVRAGGTAVSHTVWGFPWTTGSVSVWAPEPSGFGDYSFPYT